MPRPRRLPVHGVRPARRRVVVTVAIASLVIATLAVGSVGASGRAATRSITAAAPAIERITLAAPAGFRLSGTTTSTAGPVAGATVTACQTDMTQALVAVACKGGLTTSTGAWTITGLAPGRYIVRVAPPATVGAAAAAGYVGASGYVATRAAAVPVAISADRTGVRLSLPPARSLAGSVTAAGGGAVRDAFVEACAADAPPGVACTGAYTGTDGTFTIGGLGTETYVVGLQAPTGSGLASGYLGASGLVPASAAARHVAAGETGLTILLPRGVAARGAITLQGTGPAAPGQVLVQLCPDAACIYGPAASTDEDGRFTIVGLGPGTYTVSYALPRTSTHVGGYLGDGGYTPTRTTARRVTIAGSDVGGLDVALPLAAARVEGTATADGVPLRSGVVAACGTGGTCLWTRTSGRDGTFAVGLPSAGPWTVGLRSPGTLTAGLPAIWTAGMLLPADSAAMDGYLGDGAFTTDPSRATALVVGTPDRARPAVTARAPRPDATNVATSTRVVVRFTEPVTGVSGRSLMLRDAATRKSVPATVAYDPATRTAIVKPKAALAKGRRYQVVLTASITDYAGNRLLPSTWTFTTKR